jgi:hypothetical protein
MGANAYTRTDQLDSKQYVYFPPNTIEQGMKITLIIADSAVDMLTAEYAALGANAPVDINRILGNTSDLESSEIDKTSAEIDEIGVGVELVQWKDSNHECVFFNNETGVVNFLSLDSDKLRKNIHPVLLKHLQSNNITVGDDLQNPSSIDRYWEILAAMTGVSRTKKDAAEVICYCFLQYQL